MNFNHDADIMYPWSYVIPKDENMHNTLVGKDFIPNNRKLQEVILQNVENTSRSLNIEQ